LFSPHRVNYSLSYLMDFHFVKFLKRNERAAQMSLSFYFNQVSGILFFVPSFRRRLSRESAASIATCDRPCLEVLVDHPDRREDAVEPS
jgi:hypothetical protein